MRYIVNDNYFLFKTLFVALIFSLSTFSSVFSLGFYGEHIFLSDLMLFATNCFLMLTEKDKKQSAVLREYVDQLLLLLLLVVMVIGIFVMLFHRLEGRDVSDFAFFGGALFYFLRFLNWWVFFWLLVRRPIGVENWLFMMRAISVIAAFLALSVIAEALGFYSTIWMSRTTRLIVEGYTGFISPHEGHAGVIMCCAFFASLSVAVAEKFRPATLIPVGLIFISVTLMQRQSATIALIVGMTFWLFFGVKGKGLWLSALTIICLGAIANIFFSSIEGEELLATYLSADGQMTGNLGFRVIAPLAYLNYMMQEQISWIYGAGALSHAMNVSLLGGPHNQYVAIFFEFGLLGIITLLLAISRALFSLAHVPSNEFRYIGMAMLICFGVYGLASDLFLLTSFGANQFVLFILVFSGILSLAGATYGPT